MNSSSVFTDIAYAQTPQRVLKLDLHLPHLQTDKLPPLVMYIPMGGMTSCPKEYAPWWLTEYGFAVASIECRVSSEAIAPAQMQDCKAAVRWLRSHATDYGYNGELIGIWGHSAGGLLAALLATSGDLGDESDPTGVSSRVQAACDACGAPHDFAYFTKPEVKLRFQGVMENIRLYLGGTVEEKAELARSVSPRTYVSSQCPPMLLIHGDADTVVPVEETVDFYRALKEAGIDATLRLLPGIGHSWDESLTRAEIIAFFQRTLGTAG